MGLKLFAPPRLKLCLILLALLAVAPAAPAQPQVGKLINVLAPAGAGAHDIVPVRLTVRLEREAVRGEFHAYLNDHEVTTRLARASSLACFALPCDLTGELAPRDGLVSGINTLHFVVSKAGVILERDRLSFRVNGPEAEAGPDQVIKVGLPVQLDSNSSLFPNSQSRIQVWMWKLASKPPGSNARIINPDSPTPSLIPDVIGEYILTLVVSDGFPAG